MITQIFKSSLGKKYIMAVTGCFLFLFVFGHMVGNLQVFLGQEAINRYGHFLQSNTEILWPVRCAMLLCICLHVWSAVQLSLENNAARPVDYAVYKPLGSTTASRTMLMTGIIVFVFVVYHLLHYTVRLKSINLTGKDFTTLIDGENRPDIYRMIIIGFRNGWVSLFYLLGVGLLCFHLSHGTSSMLQSLGLKNDVYRRCIDRIATAVSVVIFLGYASIPLGILLGYGKNVL